MMTGERIKMQVDLLSDSNTIQNCTLRRKRIRLQTSGEGRQTKIIRRWTFNAIQTDGGQRKTITMKQEKEGNEKPEQILEKDMRG